MAGIGENLTQSLKKIINFLPISNTDFSKMGMDGQNGASPTNEAVLVNTDRYHTCKVITGASSAFCICKIKWHRFKMFDKL